MARKSNRSFTVRMSGTATTVVPSAAEPSGGGGSAAPDWAPADAKIHIDFLGGTPQGRAWVEGTGEVGIETVLGSDPLTEENAGTTGYDSAWITADGYVAQDFSPCLIGPAKVLALDAATLILRFKQIVDTIPTDRQGFLMGTENAEDELHYRLFNGSLEAIASSMNGPLSLEISEIGNDGLNAVNCMAMTVSVSHMDIAMNGSAGIGSDLDNTDRPASNPLTYIMVRTGVSEGFALQSITLYDPVPIGDLPGLSAP
jgi:hypothetical protein